MLAPFADVAPPSGVETRLVSETQLLSTVPMVVTQVARSKTSAAAFGLGAVAPRFVAVDEKET